MQKDWGVLVEGKLEGPLLISSIQVCTEFLKLYLVYIHYIYISSCMIFSATFFPPVLELCI